VTIVVVALAAVMFASVVCIVFEAMTAPLLEPDWFDRITTWRAEQDTAGGLVGEVEDWLKARAS
jgi:hypothetical protein